MCVCVPEKNKIFSKLQMEDIDKVLHPLPCTTVWHTTNNQTFRQAIDIPVTGDHNENGSNSDLEYLTGNIT